MSPGSIFKQELGLLKERGLCRAYNPAAIVTVAGFCCLWVDCAPNPALGENPSLSATYPGFDVIGYEYSDGSIAYTSAEGIWAEPCPRSRKTQTVPTGQAAIWNSVA